MQKIFDVGSAAEMLAVPKGATGFSAWMPIDQPLIDRFAEATGDRQWIHVDTQRAAREMPGGKTIAHGYLLLSLTPQLLDQTWTLRNLTHGLNYGLENVRFVSPVPVDSKVRLRIECESVMEKGDGVRLEMRAALELLGSERPALVFRQIGLFVF